MFCSARAAQHDAEFLFSCVLEIWASPSKQDKPVLHMYPLSLHDLHYNTCAAAPQVPRRCDRLITGLRAPVQHAALGLSVPVRPTVGINSTDAARHGLKAGVKLLPEALLGPFCSVQCAKRWDC